MNYLLIVGVILLNSSAILLMKKSASFYASISYTHCKDLLIWPGIYAVAGAVSLYIISLLLTIFSLTRMDISFFNPFISITFIISAIGGYLFFGETLTPTRLIGIGVIVIGVILVARSA